jgi:outer membrane protein assembly factor BamB
MRGSLIKRALWCGYFALVAAFVLRGEPKGGAFVPQPFAANPQPMRYEDATGEKTAEPLALYRANVERTGYLASRSPAGNRATLLEPDWNPGVHDASKASPVGAGGSVFVGSDAGKLAAFTENGGKLWEYQAPLASHGIHSSAAVGGNFVCFGTYHGFVVCLDRRDGHPLWMRRVGDAIGSSPLVHEGVLFVSVETTSRPDGYVVALRLRDGEMLWRSPYLGNQAHSSPALVPDAGLVVAGDNNHFLNAFRISDGTLAWRTNLGGDVKDTPMVHGGRVFATSWAGTLTAVDAANGLVLWSRGLGGRSQSSPTLLGAGDRILVSASGGGLSVVAESDGKILAKHAWDGDDADAKMPSALALRDAAWMACGSRVLCRLSADGARILAKIPLGGFVSGMPWLQDGKLFVSTTAGGGIYRIE